MLECLQILEIKLWGAEEAFIDIQSKGKEDKHNATRPFYYYSNNNSDVANEMQLFCIFNTKIKLSDKFPLICIITLFRYSFLLQQRITFVRWTLMNIQYFSEGREMCEMAHKYNFYVRKKCDIANGDRTRKKMEHHEKCI